MKASRPLHGEVLRARRSFLRFCAGSPVVAGLVGASARAGDDRGFDASLLRDPSGVLNLAEMRDVAERRVRPAPWAWVSTGSDDERTLEANRTIFGDLQLRTRRLIDVRHIDTTVELFGERYASPIGLAPVGLQNLFHADAEPGIARAAAAHSALMIAGHMSSASYTELASIGPRAPWLQLYARWPRPYLRALLDEVAGAGCGVVALTVDTPVGGNRETVARHIERMVEDGPLVFGNFPPGLEPLAETNVGMSWEFVRWLRANTSMKLLLKGIVDPEDARIAVEHGVDGLVVSNHGGRQEESGRSALESLVAVASAVPTSFPLVVDGGFRRGTDVFKALALGARLVCVGRPQIWGLGAFGQAGVERVLEVLRLELERTMRFAGALSLADIGPSSILAVRGARFDGVL